MTKAHRKGLAAAAPGLGVFHLERILRIGEIIARPCEEFDERQN
jgi:hypothetical protein